MEKNTATTGSASAPPTADDGTSQPGGQLNLPAKAFTQASAEPDSAFFASHDPAQLLDLGARTAITALYRTSMPCGGNTLDLMCGADSHLPEDASFQRFSGLDACPELLKRNQALDEGFTQDLNTNWKLPFDDDSQDGVLLCNGLPYLTKPVEVMEEVQRVLKPGAPFIVTFTDRFFPQKAVAIWQALEPAGRVALTKGAMAQAGLVDIDKGEVNPPEDLPGWQDRVHAIIGRAPRC
ncbi:class I SAM-dependent methyltransferase [Formicincola oecophyllae]|uniref:Class I SAM-dependent methyltransferase n=1 Tax=Formicincola oecophyllae TaxID=2558361 RepID=A0A4Y6UAZ3_9PROT|nr:class I SAM-dependent methyltransferase [Formicincola oecophyllae]QDH13627.1 class I SAM-dependent methyltransferase [Formicincola oecophyllae]